MANQLPDRCEWPSKHPCERPATAVLAWGDTYVCRGHEILAAANRATHGEFAISADEYREQLERAKQWFRENPAPASDEPLVPCEDCTHDGHTCAAFGCAASPRTQEMEDR